MSFEPGPVPSDPPVFGTTCQCGDYEVPGVTHMIAPDVCTVDGTGEPYKPAEDEQSPSDVEVPVEGDTKP